ncbi:MAG TPA: hypothetical protein DCZ87_06340, partial [Chitinophagaceae bacterium]|nr:hypothetical protein [Chitinophagaceae bacterium]
MVLSKVTYSAWQNRISRAFDRLMKNRTWVVLVILALGIRWAALYPLWVEYNYSTRFFPVFAHWQR